MSVLSLKKKMTTYLKKFFSFSDGVVPAATVVIRKSTVRDGVHSESQGHVRQSDGKFSDMGWYLEINLFLSFILKIVISP